MELLIDLACEMTGTHYFRSDDPVEAAPFVVTDAVVLLWAAVRERLGCDEFARRATPQLLRWERQFGWTRRGEGTIPEKETTLAQVLTEMLEVADAWLTFTGANLQVVDDGVARKSGTSWKGRERPGALAPWHTVLLDRLTELGESAQGVRLAAHPILSD